MGFQLAGGTETSQFALAYIVSPSQGETPAEPHPCRERFIDPRCAAKTLANAHSADQRSAARLEPRRPKSSPFSQNFREYQGHWAPARRLIAFSLLTSHFRLSSRAKALYPRAPALRLSALPPGGSSRVRPALCFSPEGGTSIAGGASRRKPAANHLQPSGRHIRCGAVSATPHRAPCPHLSGRAEAPGCDFRTLVRTASASRHQHPLPAGCRQAAHCVLTSHFSLLTSHFSLPSLLSRQGSLPAGFRPAAQCASALRLIAFSLQTPANLPRPAPGSPPRQQSRAHPHRYRRINIPAHRHHNTFRSNSAR
ncbi:MAG: hypothetical protein RLZZ436_3032 [Planctomycetota bacterium]